MVQQSFAMSKREGGSWEGGRRRCGGFAWGTCEKKIHDLRRNTGKEEHRVVESFLRHRNGAVFATCSQYYNANSVSFGTSIFVPSFEIYSLKNEYAFL